MLGSKTLILVGVSGAIVLSSEMEAQERSPVQYSRDESATLVQKTVDGAEWTITYEIDNGEVRGNVRGADSSTFLECDRVRVDSEELLGEFQCYSAAGCTEAPCDNDPWQSVAEVELPLSFFFPPGEEPRLGDEPEPDDEPEPEDEPFVGCCDFGPNGPCFEINGSPQSCISSGGSAAAGTCTVLGPLEDCPLGVDLQFCFVGECQ